MRASLILGSLIVAVSILAAGCGGPTDSEQAASAASAYFKALGSGDGTKTCASLTAAGKKQLAADAHEFGPAFGCVEASRVAGETYASGLSKEAQLVLEGKKSKVALDAATAEVTYPATGELKATRVSLVKEGETWKVNKVAAVGAAESARVTPDLLTGRSPSTSGKWRVVYKGSTDADLPSRTTWTIKACESGACGFKAKSSFKNSKFAFKFDRAVGDFTFNDRDLNPCVEQESKKLVAKDAYKTLYRWNVRPTKAVLSDGKLIGTEMQGDRETHTQLTSAGKSAGCSDESEDETYETVRFVRIGAPVGKEITLPGAIEGEQGE